VKLRRALSASIGLGLVCMAASACGSSSSSSSGSQVNAAKAAAHTSKPVVIGFAGAATGFVSFYDGPVKAGALLAIADINARGGVAGRKLEMISADNQSNTSQIVPAAQSVLARGADIVMPSCDYNYGGPAARLAQSMGKLAIGCAGGPLYGRQGIGPLLFNTMDGTPSEAAAMAQFAVSRHWTRPYLLDDTSLDYSKTICSYFKQAWRELGGSIAGEDTFENTDSSIASQITQMKSASYDAVVLCSYPPGGATAVKQIRAAGINAPILGPQAQDGTYWLKAIPNLSNFYNVAQGDINHDPNPARRRFFARFQATTGQPAASSVYPILGYAAIQTIVLALQKTNGDDTGAALAKAIETFHNEPLISGPTTYTANCHIPVGRPLVVVQIQNGKSSYVGTVKPTKVPPAPC
jgi:branched-chain amino acid transport system substrate-binding protein